MNENMRTDILRDIVRCKAQCEEEGSQGLYEELIARYTVYFPDFKNGLPFISKASTSGVFDYRSDLKAIASKLESILKIYENGGDNGISPASNCKNDGARFKHKVFIVHGRDNEAKQEVARFVEKIGLEAVILHEQADCGKTIIEKLESCTDDLSFAIVLYTFCDWGRPKDSDKDIPRARQNVVFEHGYLISKLGRDHVTALLKDDVEKPGDLDGIVYIKMDKAGAWKTSLVKNIEALGFSVDLSGLF